MTLEIGDATRSRLAAPAVRGFLRIAEQWGLSEAQQVSILGGSADVLTLAGWRQTTPVTLPAGHLERLSYVVGIYEGLERIFRHEPEHSRRWLSASRPGAPFVGRTPLELMISDGVVGLAAVRQYVDGVSGGPPSRDGALPPRDVAG